MATVTKSTAVVVTITLSEDEAKRLRGLIGSTTNHPGLLDLYQALVETVGF